MDYKIKPIRKYEEYAEHEAEYAENGMELLLSSIYDNFLVDEIEEDEEDGYGSSYFEDYNTPYYREQLLQYLGYSGAKKELANTRLFNGNSKFEVEVHDLPKILEKNEIRDFFFEIGKIHDFARIFNLCSFKEENNISNFLQRKALHITKEMVEEPFKEYRGLNEYHLLKMATLAVINDNIYAALNKGLDVTNENGTTAEKMMPETYHILISLIRYFEDIVCSNRSKRLEKGSFKTVYDSMASMTYDSPTLISDSQKISKIAYITPHLNRYLATYDNIEEYLDKYIELFTLYGQDDAEAILGNRAYLLQVSEETGHIEKIFYVHLGAKKVLQTINIADFQEEYNKLYTALATLYASTVLYRTEREAERTTNATVSDAVKKELLSQLIESLNSPYGLIVDRDKSIIKVREVYELSIDRYYDYDYSFNRIDATFNRFSSILMTDGISIPFKERKGTSAEELVRKQRNIKFDITDSEINKLNSINSLVKQIKFMADVFRRKWLNADSLTRLLYIDDSDSVKVLDAKQILAKSDAAYEAFKCLETPNAELVMAEVIKVLKRKSSWQLDRLEKSFSRISSNVQYKDVVKWVFSLEAQDILTASVNDHDWSSCHASSYGNTPMALMSNGVTFVIYEEEGDKLLYEIDNKVNRTYAHYKEEYGCMPNGEIKRTLVLEGAYPRQHNKMLQQALINVIAEITGNTDIEVVNAEDAMFFGKDYNYDEDDYEYEVPDDFIKCGYYDYFESNRQVGFQDGDYVEYLPTSIARYVPNLFDLNDDMSYFYDNRSNYDCLWH